MSVHLSRFHQSWKSLILSSQRCTTIQQIKETHALFIINGIHRNTYAISKILTAFLPLPNSNTHFHYASAIFESIESRNSFVYDSMIRICSRSSSPHLGLRYFKLMVKEDEEDSVSPSYLTFHFLLVACLNACLFSVGKQIHCWAVKNGVLSSDGHVQTGIMRVYVEDKVLSDAHKVFDEIPHPDVVKWDVLMNGYVRCGLGSEGLELFREMLVRGIEPDEFSVTTVLTACAQVGNLTQGRTVHEFIKKKKKWVETDVFVGTALVDMYAKCGCIEMAIEVFEKLSRRNVFSWAALIGGYAAYGYATEAIKCLEQMVREDGIKPDGVVLLGVLTACAHGGFLQEGRTMLDNMEARYGVTPKHEHFSCVVDLMCRGGRLDDALDLIGNMPMKPLASVWGALLNGCRTHKNVTLGELAVRNLLELEKGNGDEEEAALVQLSSIYSTVERNAEASQVRRMISQRGIRTTPGWSMLEVDGHVTKFVSGDMSRSHPNWLQIHAMIHLLSVGALHIP